MNASKLVNSLLSRSHVRIRNAETVTKKIQSMVQATSGRLMVFNFLNLYRYFIQTIADFDYTLSRYHKNGQKCITTHGLFEDVAADISSDFRERICSLRDKYIVIEYCPETQMEDKIPMMEQWWRESHGLIEQVFVRKMISSLLLFFSIDQRDLRFVKQLKDQRN
jgi:hypothetical protein